MEIYRDIQGYEGLYAVSNFGNVKNTRRNKVLKCKITKWGYHKVNLSKDGVLKTYLVHRLVADTFIPNPDNLPQINHRDECKTNNRVDNLEWCSDGYNQNYGTRNERISRSKINSPLISKPIVCVETGIVYQSGYDVERRLGYDQGNVCNCCNGKNKTAYGYHWQYIT